MSTTMTDALSLHEACYLGRLDAVALLLALGADPNEPAGASGRRWVSCGGDRPTPLHCVAIAWAITQEHVEIARLLVERGAVVHDSVLRDLELESVGTATERALRRILVAARAT